MAFGTIEHQPATCPSTNALRHPAAGAEPQIGFEAWLTREPTSLPFQIMCMSAPAAGSTASPTPSISGSRFPAAGRSAVRARTSTRRIVRIQLVSRPSRRSRGGCGTSLNATAESGIRSGSESNDSPQALREMIRHRQPQRKPSLHWNVPTPFGKACSMSCRQILGGSRWAPLPARTPRTTKRRSCSISLTSKSITVRSLGCCVTSTDTAGHRIGQPSPPTKFGLFEPAPRADLHRPASTGFRRASALVLSS